MDIQWFSPLKSKTKCKYDVSVALYAKSGDVRFSFSNGSKERITDLDRITIGICGNRIYFKGVDNRAAGYKVNTLSNCCSFSIRQRTLFVFFKKRKQEYDLQYDVDNCMYYIEDNESEV